MLKDKEAELEREEWIMIGHLSYDGDAEIVSSLFDSQDIPVLIQGRNHRRMLGFIGGHIQLRVLVPKARKDDGLSLLNSYHQQRDDESFMPPSEEELQGERNWLLFNETGKKLGIALFLCMFLGFGLASLSAGLWWIALILACLQLTSFSATMSLSIASALGITVEVYQANLPTYVALVDLLISWTYLLLFTRPNKLE